MRDASGPPRLVPELVVTNVAVSLRFWVGVLGFEVVYDRPEHGFALIERSGVRFMLEQLDLADRVWRTAALEPPLGRGVNFEIDVDRLTPLIDRLAAAGVPMFMDMEEKWYRQGAVEIGVRQFLVQDPDGYLLRFSERIGTRRRRS